MDIILQQRTCTSPGVSYISGVNNKLAIKFTMEVWKQSWTHKQQHGFTPWAAMGPLSQSEQLFTPQKQLRFSQLGKIIYLMTLAQLTKAPHKSLKWWFGLIFAWRFNVKSFILELVFPIIWHTESYLQILVVVAVV